MKNKLLIVSILGFLLLLIYIKFDYKYHEYIIDNIYENDINYNYQDYVGYIEIKRLNIKREIVLGINYENLKEHVAINDLDAKTVILAGHSVVNIFGNLHFAKLNDIIKISLLKEVNYYQIVDISVVYKDNVDILEGCDLILITCMTNNNKRLIIKANRI